MLKIVLNRLQPQAERDHCRRTSWFQSGKEHRTTKQSPDPLREKPATSAESLQEGCGMTPYEATMGKYNTNANIIRDIENQYDKAQRAVLSNGSIGDWFRDRQGCILSPAPFIIFLERIICALDEHEGSVSVGGRIITNDGIVVNAQEEEEADLR